MEMKFCRRCGQVLRLSSGHVFVCANNHVIFRNSSPAVVLILVNEEKNPLIAVRSIDPGKGKLHVPAGFCDDAETFEQAIERELKEELALSSADYSAPEYLLSQLDEYEYKGEIIPVLSAVYWARIDSSTSITSGDDLEAAEFVPYDRIDFGNIQFKAVADGLRRLRELEAI